MAIHGVTGAAIPTNSLERDDGSGVLYKGLQETHSKRVSGPCSKEPGPNGIINCPDEVERAIPAFASSTADLFTPGKDMAEVEDTIYPSMSAVGKRDINSYKDLTHHCVKGKHWAKTSNNPPYCWQTGDPDWATKYSPNLWDWCYVKVDCKVGNFQVPSKIPFTKRDLVTDLDDIAFAAYPKLKARQNLNPFPSPSAGGDPSATSDPSAGGDPSATSDPSASGDSSSDEDPSPTLPPPTVSARYASHINGRDVVIPRASAAGCHAKGTDLYFQNSQLQSTCNAELVKGTAYYQQATKGLVTWDLNLMYKCFEMAGCDGGLQLPAQVSQE
ncbi:MAG: hypothetical protein Q9170_005922 [Blastenia crenularia]